MKEEKIISALIGLVGACNNNPKSPNTDSVVVNALAFAEMNKACDEALISAEVEKIHAEKNAVAPNCANCKFPCGNTSDYDMNRLYTADEEIKSVKMLIISRLEVLAKSVLHNENHTQLELLYKALALVGYDLPKERLQELAQELENVINKNGGTDND